MINEIITLKTKVMKKRLVLIPGILSLMFMFSSCDEETGECDADPEVCACINDPLTCVSPVGSSETSSDSVETISKFSDEE